MKAILIKNGTIVNEGLSKKGSILIYNSLIQKIIYESDYPSVSLYLSAVSQAQTDYDCKVIDALNLTVIPGMIDTHVHFRQPGNTDAGDIESESIAALKGGVTTCFDMPNNTPPVVSIDSLESKYNIARDSSYVNYSFYLGATNNNLDQILSLDTNQNCGVKLFLGASTGNLLVDSDSAIYDVFKKCSTIVAVHAEDNDIISQSTQKIKKLYNDNIPTSAHPLVRPREGCISAVKKAIHLAIDNGTKLHILHLSTSEEVELLRELYIKDSSLRENITAETCPHYLWFSSEDYPKLGNKIKCNPSIKSIEDMIALRKGIRDDIISTIGSDHAPHQLDKKLRSYIEAPSGIPLVEYSLLILLELVKQEIFTIEKIVEKTSHSPSRIFNIKNRGFIKEGYFADIAIIDTNAKNKESTQYPSSKCGWSPFSPEFVFSSEVKYTIVNGEIAFDRENNSLNRVAQRVEFVH